jgi:signal transduction histidine kinase
MIPAPLPANETERQRWLDDLQILDTLEEQAYDDLTFLAAQICQTPIALVSLVDRNRQWFKSHHGLNAQETPRDLAFCAHAILDDKPLVVEDPLQDERFRDNPLVTGAPHVHFYAGAPLILRQNVHVGTLCVIDDHARPLSDMQRQALEAIARQVVSLLELRLQVQALSRLDTTKDEFISMVNHELRTPLTSIHGSLSLLRNQVTGAIPEHALQMLDVAYRNGERLLNIVNDILDVSKLEAGKMEMHMATIDLFSFLQKAIDLSQPYCAGLGCRIDLRTADATDPVQVLGDEPRLLQVMNNLVSNAAKFGRAGDTVEISWQREAGRVQVRVTDHGRGIPPEKHKDLFSKFKQLSQDSNAKAAGTGLGLSICKLIVEQHGGSIGCESMPNDHTTFFFTLREPQ